MGEFSKESFPSVKSILILDSEGKRVAVKYFSDDWSTNASKLTFEKSVFTKTLKTNARSEDLHFFVIAGDDENELITANVLQGFSDSVGLLLVLITNMNLYFATDSSHVGSELTTNDNANNAANGHSGEELDGANKTLKTSHR
ncbi:hypothetical protein ABZP36_004749 [Zizania latifolia]